MTDKIIPALLTCKRGTAAALASSNPVLAAGELCVETDTRKVKVGDGSTYWNNLSYLSLVPIGLISHFGASAAPSGWLICNGAAISRAAYPELYAKIGTTFGAGNGSTTFNLPDLRDIFAQGANGNVGTIKAAGLPNINGEVAYGLLCHGNSRENGCLKMTRGSPYSIEGTGNAATYTAAITFTASNSNEIYGDSSTVQPPSLALLPCIYYGG